MNAEVLLEDGRFYLYPRNAGRGRLEMPLVAEGIRKIAMLAYLLINGVLRNRSILFWDRAGDQSPSQVNAQSGEDTSTLDP